MWGSRFTTAGAAFVQSSPDHVYYYKAGAYRLCMFLDGGKNKSNIFSIHPICKCLMKLVT